MAIYDSTSPPQTITAGTVYQHYSDQLRPGLLTHVSIELPSTTTIVGLPSARIGIAKADGVIMWLTGVYPVGNGLSIAWTGNIPIDAGMVYRIVCELTSDADMTAGVLFGWAQA